MAQGITQAAVCQLEAQEWVGGVDTATVRKASSSELTSTWDIGDTDKYLDRGDILLGQR